MNPHDEDILKPDMAEESTQETAPAKEEKKEEYKDQWLRAVADYHNLQKEMSSQRAEWARMSEVQVIEEFLPVYDNFKKAFAHKPASDDKQWQNWATGIGFIMQQFSTVLKAHDIEEMKTVGEVFDPTKHDTVGEEAAEGKAPGTIIREVDGGYNLKGKVIKVAKVIVAAGEP